MANVSQTPPRVEPKGPELRPAREVDLKRAARVGLIGGVAGVFFSAVGMVEALEVRVLVNPGVTAALVLIALFFLAPGYLAGRPPEQLEGYEEPLPGGRNVLAGVIAGLLSGVVLVLFVLLASAVNLRPVLNAVTGRLVEVLTFDQGIAAGSALLLAASLAGGTLAGALYLLGHRLRRGIMGAAGGALAFGLLQVVGSQIFRGLRLRSVGDFFYEGTGGLSLPGAVITAVAFFVLFFLVRARERQFVEDVVASENGRRSRLLSVVGLVILVGALAALPQVLGNFLSSALVLAGVFLLMALGLNIVIGYAGLLDLGYVAFFAVGAYTAAVLTSTASPRVSAELTFWIAIPFIVLAAAVAGLMVGTPVLRMRGDYLAIVTLGFGEIARLVLLSDWQKPNFGGAQGIARIPTIKIGPLEFITAQDYVYLIVGAALVFAYISWALQNSRIGRAWMAMREDESVAEVMGVNTVSAKLWAFVIGAIFASIGGALFAHRLTTVYPHSFNIVVSITVVVIVIVGGMASVPGVVLAAVVLIALPELLREFEEFKFLLYGMLLIYMMLQRPEGFIPSRRRARELLSEEQAQDAWLRAAEEAGGAEQPAESS